MEDIIEYIHKRGAMIFKKSLVLLGVEKQREKAILTLEKDGDVFGGRIRLYNFAVEPEGILSIGFYDGKEVIKAGLSKIASMLYSFKLGQDKVDQDFSCAVISFTKGRTTPILYGNSRGAEDIEIELAKIMNQDLGKVNDPLSAKKVLDSANVVYTDAYQKEIENNIDEQMCKACENCRYKKAFYEQKFEKMSQGNKNVSEDKEELKSDSYYDKIKSRIDELFSKNKKEDFLENLIPNSKWVKVEYEDDGDYYIVGLIYDGDLLKYIVYGVPGVYQKSPPKEVAGFPIWFPLDQDRPESFGYWLSYQDADTGESLRAEIE